jgi:hypothetical protein
LLSGEPQRLDHVVNLVPDLGGKKTEGRHFLCLHKFFEVVPVFLFQAAFALHLFQQL